MIPGHECNVYCDSSGHVELVYVAAGMNPHGMLDSLWQAYAARYHVWVTECQMVEAPPIDEQTDPTIWHDRLCGTELGTEPWMVRWRTDYDAARQEWEARR